MLKVEELGEDYVQLRILLRVSTFYLPNLYGCISVGAGNWALQLREQ